MTIEEQIAHNKAISQYMFSVAFPLGMWFVIEYFFWILSTRSIMIATIRPALMLITPAALCFLLYKLRGRFFETETFGRFRCWYYGTQIMFYAGLIEAFAIAVYNQWIAPDNLLEMHNAMIAQYENVTSMATQNPSIGQVAPSMAKTLSETVQMLKEAEIETPFAAAINMLSNDIFYGALWSLIFCFILRRKPRANEKEDKEQTPES